MHTYLYLYHSTVLKLIGFIFFRQMKSKLFPTTFENQLILLFTNYSAHDTEGPNNFVTELKWIGFIFYRYNIIMNE